MRTALMMLKTGALVLGFAVIAGATAARPGLANEDSINEGLIATAMAYEIGRRCESLDARIVPGLNYLYSLRAQARELGYSEREIDAYINSDAEQERMKELAYRRFESLGGVRDDYETYCAVGRAQIAAGTQTGLLLR